jgi:hypothetical protein
MKTEKILGDYVFTIERENGKGVDVPITEFDYVPSEAFNVDIRIYGENISNYFSNLMPFSAQQNRLLNKAELLFNCRITDSDDNHVATLHSAYISSYNHIPNTDMETISLRADYFEVGHVVSASTKFAEMSAELNKEAEETARKYADMNDGW